jgi:Arc/MetJ-type ribon-helix-helix transcriptional regulator
MIAHALHISERGVGVTAKTVGFAIADEDRERLDALVEHFGKGNRSEFLRVAMRRLQRDMLAERMQALQTRARAELNGRVVERDEVAALVRQTLRDHA